MPFKGSRGPIIIGILIFITFIVVIGVAASINSTPRKIGLPGAVVFSVKAETGVSFVEITNEDTDQTILLEKSDMPYLFNCTQGDTLLFRVTTLSNYYFNSWRFNTNIYGSFDHHNPLYLTVDTPVTMTATVIYVEPTASPTPIPTPTPSVIE